MSRFNNILLLRPDKAGDAIKTLPVLRALSRCARLKINLLASRHNASLFQFEDNITTFVYPDDRTVFEKNFDVVINLLCDPNKEMDSILSDLKGVRKYSAHSSLKDIHRLSLKNNSSKGIDETENILFLVSQVVEEQIKISWVKSSPNFSEKDEIEAKGMGHKRGCWIGMAPFAGLKSRSHPNRLWSKLIRQVIKDKKFEKVFLFSSLEEKDKLVELFQLLPKNDVISMVYPSSFRVFGCYIKRLDGFIAADSGPLHLAISLKVPSLGILSGGDVKRWYGKTNHYDYLVRRGVFGPRPHFFQVKWAYQKWKKSLFLYST